MTVTVQRETSKSEDAGDTDVGIADHLLGLVRQLYVDAHNQLQQHYFYQVSALLEAKVQEMTGREDVGWFDAIRPARQMEYKCDSKLAGPKAVDCAKLEYQGLGDGTVDFKKGETKYFDQGGSLPAMGTVLFCDKC